MKIIRRITYILSALFFFFVMASCGNTDISSEEIITSMDSETESESPSTEEMSSSVTEGDTGHEVENFTLYFIDYSEYFDYLNNPSEEYYIKPEDLETGKDYVLTASFDFDGTDILPDKLDFTLESYGLHFKSFLTASSSEVTIDLFGSKAEILCSNIEKKNKSVSFEMLLTALQDYDIYVYFKVGMDEELVYLCGTYPIASKKSGFSYSLNEDGTFNLEKYYGDSEEVVIPDNVSVIAESAFKGNKTIKKLIIPDSVKKIEPDAFASCSNLTDVIIGKGCESVCSGAFYHCSNLTDVTLSEGIVSLEANAFSDCLKLKSIIIPDSVTEIGASAFSNCTELESITLPFIGENAIENQYLGYIFGASSYEENPKYIPTSLKEVITGNACTYVSQYSFYGCTSLTNVIVSDNVTEIGFSAFSGCNNLESITLPFIGENTGKNQFLGYLFGTSKSVNNAENIPSSLKKVTIGNKCTSLELRAFYECSNLTEIILPDSLLSIGNNVFYNCSGLKGILLPDKLTSLGDSVFSGCSSLESIVIPVSVTKTGNEIFAACTNLKEISISENITSIGSNAFYNCTSLTDITIPGNVESIYNNAFYGCMELKDITFEGTKEQWNNAISSHYKWDYNSGLCTVHCNDGDIE